MKKGSSIHSLSNVHQKMRNLIFADKFINRKLMSFIVKIYFPFYRKQYIPKNHHLHNIHIQNIVQVFMKIIYFLLLNLFFIFLKCKIINFNLVLFIQAFRVSFLTFNQLITYFIKVTFNY